MKCIYCKRKKTQVVNSREIKKGLMTWRRRLCTNCGNIFTTKESAVADNLFVLKRNNSKQRFVYEKLFASVFVSVNNRKNSDNGDDAKLTKRIVESIIEKVFSNSRNKTISSKTIVQVIYKELKKIDRSYADRYASYSNFRLKTLLQLGVVRMPGIYN